jgi:hypothetical protein
MRSLIAMVLWAIPVLAQQAPSPTLSANDTIRIREFYRLASAIQDGVWPGWSKTPAPLMLVTAEEEFLTHHPMPPQEWKKVAEDVYARPRQFPTALEATFPAFGPPAVMVVGQPPNTKSKASTSWVLMVMHEHFHQLQWAQPGYVDAVNNLGLRGEDTTGMWMLNYPFPYEKPEVVQSFGQLRDLLLRAVNEKDEATFQKLVSDYGAQRKKFFSQVSADDHKYFSFQLWQEGIARYTQIKSAEAAAHYDPTPQFAALSDFEAFASYAARVRTDTLNELKQADMATWKRTVVYSFGATEGLLLDRINPKWKDEYFHRTLSMDSYFDTGDKSAHP